MRVLFLSPAFPGEMRSFVRALAETGADVIGVADTPRAALGPEVSSYLAGYEQVPGMWSEADGFEQLRRIIDRERIEAVECLWEPGVILAARLREAGGLPGMGPEQAQLFRDKEKMKLALDAAGIRTPRHERCTNSRECYAAAERIGFPLIVKPIAGAGSADTHRVDNARELEAVLPRLGHLVEVSVEEFIEGEEFTFDTVCAGGRILFHSVCWYRPKPLIGRNLEWTSPQTVGLRDPDQPVLAPGVRLGREVIAALGFDTGYTHMEWFRRPDGEAVFGEIAARPPGALSVEVTNHAACFDTYRAWADAVCHGELSGAPERRYNTAIVFKRARGEGRIRAIEGLGSLMARYGQHVVDLELLPLGAPRRNWKQTLLSDGHVLLRHPDLAATLEMADRFGSELTLWAS